jgi:uncharacterized Zn-binding protein involved in type VI secretion
MMQAVARLGDTGSHGGSITTASTDVFADGKGVARVGDTYNCPIHGPNPIVSGSNLYYVDNKQVVRVGDTTQCGATITTGSPTVFSD